MKTTVQEKARKSFDYQCKKASKCRHEKYIQSCNVCVLLETCNIKKAQEKAKSKF